MQRRIKEAKLVLSEGLGFYVAELELQAVDFCTPSQTASEQ